MGAREEARVPGRAAVAHAHGRDEEQAVLPAGRALARGLAGLCAALLTGPVLTACTAEEGGSQPASEEPATAETTAPGPSPAADQALSEPPESIDIAWSELPGSTVDVGIGGVGEDQSLWAVGGGSVPGGYEISYWNGTDWETVEGGAVAIDVAPTGHPWVVDAENRILEWDGAGWIERPGTAHDIGIGADGSVWIVGTEPAPGGYHIYRWTEAMWEEAPGGAVALDVYSRGDPDVRLQPEPWIVDADGYIARWTGSEWSRQPGTARDVGVGANGTVWIIGTDAVSGGYAVATWNGEGWASAPGGGLRVSVDADGFPYVVTDQNKLLRGT
ncbi:tectonin domain-containing protein [Georgenia sp. AZ-5]|uniref:tectonin domain-containing protein n=1 Tax=Georgenia sp. AZ-5 TaxID=3367526 RepID=UPI003754D298